MRYYISDNHFFHDSLLNRMDRRGFSSVEEMNAYMIDKINGKVRKNDELVFLGDFSVGNANQTNDILAQIHCKNLMLILGNHDKYAAKTTFNRERFQWIKHYHEVSDNNRRVILSHYYIPNYNAQYRRDRNGNPTTYMLYGHVHNTMDLKYNDDIQEYLRGQTRKAFGYEAPVTVPTQAINCFCMFSDYEPLSLDEWIELEKTRKEKFPYQQDEA